jgi:hypothetical protein
MPRSSPEAVSMARYAVEAPKLEPPKDLTREQAQCWRDILADLPADWVTSAVVPLLVEYCRHISYAKKVAEQLDRMRTTPLTGTEDADSNRATYLEFAELARQESRLISDLGIKLRFCKQTRINSVTAAHARNRLHGGPKPWEFSVAGGTDVDDDDGGAGPTN